MLKFYCRLIILCALCSTAQSAPSFDRVFYIVFENKNAENVLMHSFFKELSQSGALLKKMSGVIHPSQGNYIAMIAGDYFGITHDNPVQLNEQHIGDLLEAKGRRWTLYAEDFPGNCYLGKEKGKYVRKHVPFISFTNVSKNSSRCAHIKNANEFQKDLQNHNLADYIMYIPNINNDGHDTDLAYSNKYFEEKFGALFRDSTFLQNTLVIVTFDEDESPSKNYIYTVLLGSPVLSGTSTNQNLNHYSLLRMIEEAWGLGNLGRKDVNAIVPTGIWK